MNRREALKTVSFIFGTTVIGAEAFLSGCVNQNNAYDLSDEDLTFLNQFGETILPKTDTPGALEADVASFMKVITTDFYTTDEQKLFKDGIHHVNNKSAHQFDKTFVDLSAENRQALLSHLEEEAAGHFKEGREEPHFYIMFKQLTIWGYFSSEIVARQAFIFAPLVEKFIGSIDYQPAGKVVYTDFGRSGSAYAAAIDSVSKS